MAAGQQPRGRAAAGAAAAYRARQEAFVRGLDGTSMAEVALIVTALPAGIWLASLAARALGIRGAGGKGARSLRRFAVELACVAGPVLVAMTRGADDPAGLGANLALAVAAACSAVLVRWRETRAETALEDLEQHENAGHVTALRSGLLLMTCAAILAVDFAVFPRRFAKTETTGTSLMDIGVGGFVVSNAIVLGISGAYENFQASMPRALSSTGVLVVIGLARLALTKGVEYQEHVTEYGVHWNFFFTLAAVSLGSSLLYGRLLPRSLVQRPGLVGALLLGLHQVLLSRGGIEAWVMEAPRTNLLSQNKEGLASILGYLSLFSLSLWLGRFHATFLRAASGASRSLIVHLLCGGALYGATNLAVIYVNPVSRRLANPAYVLWTLAVSQQILAQIMVLQVAVPPPLRLGASPGLLMEAINYNQLAVFLLANILTGICNLSVRTLDTEDDAAMGILSCYLFIVTCVAFLLYRLQWKVHPLRAVLKLRSPIQTG